MNVLDMLQNRYPGMFGGGGGSPAGGSTLVRGTVGGGAGAGGGDMFSPTPTTGQGAYGLVPGQIQVPGGASRSINNDLNGVVSPEIAAKLQNEAARFGVSSGMPGSGLQWNSYLHDYLGASDAARDRGFKHYSELLPVAEQNALNAAAPDPTQRAQTEQSFAQQMFDRYLASLRGGGGGSPRSYAPNPAGGTGDFAATPAAGASSAPGNPAAGTVSRPGGTVDFQPSNERPWDWGAPGGTWYDASNDTYNAPGSMGQGTQLSQNDIDRLIEQYMNAGDAWQ